MHSDSSAFTAKRDPNILKFLLPVGIKQSHTDSTFLNMRATWDTGAMMTTINEKFALELGLQKIDERECHSASGPYMAGVYYADIKLPNDVVLPNMIVYGASLGDHMDMLIGMDIILKGDSSITHDSENNVILSFIMPPYKTNDYVEIIENDKKLRQIIKSKSK